VLLLTYHLVSDPPENLEWTWHLRGERVTADDGQYKETGAFTLDADMGASSSMLPTAPRQQATNQLHGAESFFRS